MSTDVFCKIIAGEIPSNKIAESADWIAIHDIRPKAPVHALIIPKKHIISVAGLEAGDRELAGTLLLAVKQIGEKLGIAKDGYRVMISHGQHGGQEVPHFHIHVLGGKQF